MTLQCKAYLVEEARGALRRRWVSCGSRVGQGWWVRSPDRACPSVRPRTWAFCTLAALAWRSLFCHCLLWKPVPPTDPGDPGHPLHASATSSAGLFPQPAPQREAYYNYCWATQTSSAANSLAAWWAEPHFSSKRTPPSLFFHGYSPSALGHHMEFPCIFQSFFIVLYIKLLFNPLCL